MTPEQREQVRAELLAEVVAWLVKKAREHRARGPLFELEANLIATLASKVQRGAIRPNNLASLPAQGGPEDVPALLAEVQRLRAELAERNAQFADAAAGLAEQVQRYGKRQREHLADREELEHLRDRVAELAARPSRVEVLRSAADEIDTTADEMERVLGRTLETSSVERAVADRLRRMAAAAEGETVRPLATGTEYAIRRADGTILDPRTGHGVSGEDEAVRAETVARLGRYRDCWPDAGMVQRTATYGPWTPVATAAERGWCPGFPGCACPTTPAEGGTGGAR